MRTMYGPRMLHEAAGRQFELLGARESALGCDSLELWDVAPAPGLGLLASVARCEDTDELNFMAFTQDQMPFSAIEWFVSHARRTLCPESHTGGDDS